MITGDRNVQKRCSTSPRGGVPLEIGIALGWSPASNSEGGKGFFAGEVQTRGGPLNCAVCEDFRRQAIHR